MTTAMTATAWRFSAVVFFVMVTMVTTAAAAKEWEVKEIKFGEEKKNMITGLLSIAFFYSRYAISRNCVIKIKITLLLHYHFFLIIMSWNQKKKKKNLACISFLPMMATTSMAFFRWPMWRRRFLFIVALYLSRRLLLQIWLFFNTSCCFSGWQ